MPNISGPDVSNYQPNFNWAAAKAAGANFGVTRGTLGHVYKDPQYDRNIRTMLDLGIVPMAYFVLTPNIDAADHVRNIEAVIRSGPKPMYLWLDVERADSQGNSTIRDRCYWTLKGMEDLGFKDRVGIYTAAWFWNPHLDDEVMAIDPIGYKDHPDAWDLWVADYGPNNGLVPARMPILPI